MEVSGGNIKIVQAQDDSRLQDGENDLDRLRVLRAFACRCQLEQQFTHTSQVFAL